VTPFVAMLLTGVVNTVGCSLDMDDGGLSAVFAKVVMCCLATLGWARVFAELLS
jgi:hypothetical protein